MRTRETAREEEMNLTRNGRGELEENGAVLTRRDWLGELLPSLGA